MIVRMKMPQARLSGFGGLTMTAATRTSRACLLGLMGAALVLPACVRNAATGRLQLNSMSRAQEIALGIESRPQILEAYGGEIADAEIREYIDEVGRSLAVHTEAEYPSLPWTFTLLDSDVLNAFALPGGQVFISRGLAEQLGSEAALAGVLGHEIGHVTAEHVDQRIGRQLVLAGVAAGAAAAASGSESQWAQTAAGLTVSGAGVFALRYDRKQELEADQLGMRYMRLARYDPSALLEVMEALAEGSGGNTQPEFFSTHPHPETRIEKITSRMGNPKYAETVGNPEYGRYESRYQDRLLRRLSMLGEAAHADLAMLPPHLYCGVCAAGRTGR